MSVKLKDNIENARTLWSNIAKKNGWYTTPFYVQVWHDANGNIFDSVAHRDMTNDVLIQLTESEYYD